MSLLDKFLRVSVGEPAKGMGAVINRGINKTIDAGLSSTRALVKKTEPTFFNGYTGLKPTGIANAIGWGAAAGYVGYSAMKTRATPVMGMVEYEGQAPVMTGDGMGVSNAPSLGANGSLVFGLNAMRKGR